MNYIKIDTEDICNGDGLRVVLWLSGCSHHCHNCQNPQTWDINSGIPFDEKAKEELFRELDKDYISGLTLTGGDPLHPSNLDGVLDIVTEFNKRYKTTQDIALNKYNDHNMLNENVNKIRLLSPNKSIWLYTGYTWSDIWCNEAVLQTDYTLDYYNNVSLNHKKRQNIVSQCDVIVDGRYIDSQKDITLRWRGSSNQKVIDCQKSLQQHKVVLYCE